MTDGVTLNPGTGGAGIDAELLPNGRYAQRVKIVFGALDTDGGDWNSANPAPFSLIGSAAVTGTFWQATQPVSIASMPSTPVTGTFWQSIQPVSGAVTANAGSGTFAISAAALPLPTGAATATGVAAVVTALGSPFQAGGAITNTVFGATQSGAWSTGRTWALTSGADSITATISGIPAVSQSGAWSMGLTGTLPAFAATPTVNIGTMPAVTGTFWPATQPVSTIDGGDIAQGAKADAAYTDATGATAASISSVLKGLFVKLSGILKVDAVVQSAEIDRYTVVGFTGAVFSTTIASNTITMTTAPSAGALVLGQIMTVTNIPIGSYLYSLASGTMNAVGSTYLLSSSASSLVAANATATASAAAGSSVGPQPLMTANTSRRALEVQNQNSIGNVWIDSAQNATAGNHSRKIVPGGFYENPTGRVPTTAISIISDTPALPVYAREV